MPVPKDQIRYLLEIVGLVSIVASLVFVGLQLRQSQEIAIAGQYQARADNLANLYLELAINEIDSRPPSLPTDGFSEADFNRRVIFLNWVLATFENNHMQHELGFVDEASWTAMTNRVQGIFAIEFNQQHLENEKAHYRKPFTDWIESLNK